MTDTTEQLANISKKISINNKKRRRHTRALSQLDYHLSRLREEMLQLLSKEKRGT